MMKDFGFGAMVLAIGLAMLFSVVLGCMAIWQPFKVWMAGYTVQQQQLIGKAEFVRAEQNRMILVEQARAERDSSELRAEAISIVGQAVQNFPEYRQQEFIGALGDALRHGDISQIMYIPTEAMIPITEATRKPEQ